MFRVLDLEQRFSVTRSPKGVLEQMVLGHLNLRKGVESSGCMNMNYSYRLKEQRSLLDDSKS